MDTGESRTRGPASAESSTGPVALRILVGTHLKRFREAAGVSRPESADLLRGSEAKISRIESGRVGFKQRDVADLLTLYGVTDETERTDFLALARRASEPGWWQPFSDAMPEWFSTYVGLEQAAVSIRTYEPQLIPGLLQTEGYARAVIELGRPAPLEDIDRRIALRMGRQEILESATAPGYWAVIDEAALRRPMGSDQAMRDQLEHLLKVSDLPNVSLQVLPFNKSGAAAAGGPFILLRFAHADLPDIVYLEQLTSALYLDKTYDVETYRVLIDRLAAVALTPQRSQAMIASLRGMF
ncbi:helix-turn-helix domain-containing protein [Pseudonocardia sp. HH130630-07]|uniref:helix-turn-helix domain-containing protein n=1 Tax=Pseudonocardia sp. HH130630-07 TaxID=1690815 RepID=UPI000814E069|nr:helix-turn-helix transcriptional regulator [Pseudonocardia sp. HH130630-07]ANY09528.1 XRE family transcriptional regulator [Pseudonocardia sp. HH130630-07]